MWIFLLCMTVKRKVSIKLKKELVIEWDEEKEEEDEEEKNN